jgi:ATPase family associated with various cellular activities (AAA)
MQLTDKYRPTTIEAFAGVDRPKAILAASAANPYPAAFLLVGPSGIGKTTIGLALAEEINAEVQHVPSRRCDLDTVQELVRTCHYVPMLGKDWWLNLVDEADQMSLAAQHAFLSALDTTAFPPNTVFVFTANHTAKLEDRFLSRCRRIQFTTDGMLEPVTAFLKKVWKAETKGKKGKAPDEPDFELILRTAKFNIREALMLLETEILCPGSVCEEAPALPSSSGKSGSSAQIGKGNGAGKLYTIGADGYSPELMAETINALGVHTLVDCCWKPRRAFRSALGDSYQWAGDRLSGGRTSTDLREEGLKWLIGLLTSGKNLMLMYPAENPGECNRHHLIAIELLKRGVDAIHVFDDQLIQASEFQQSIDEDREYNFKKWRLPKVVGGSSTKGRGI